ncbi:MAG: fused MFS/spermidine synthase, partial [Rubrobacter sp.]|nr:fused MFS/spermidine synthase [Rubrobacter sp.]
MTHPNNKNTNPQIKKRSPSGAIVMMALFSLTIFLSAGLLFLIEPMFAKFVLPSFGGTPAVWTGSMMFFQAALLSSYLYVHATAAKLGARKQAVVHLVVMLLPLLVLPVAVPAQEWAPPAESNPILWLLGLLLVSVGLPFFAVAATNPLIQRWLSETDHPASKDPYFLYVASNLGSVIGLLGYPLLVEPSLRLVNQGAMWSIGYVVLVVLVFASAVVLWRSPAPSTTTAAESSSIEQQQEEEAAGGVAGDLVAPLRGGLTLMRRLRWIALAFVPSSLMLGVTAFITTDITPVPLLWVIPLSLYLFSFVIVFAPTVRLPQLLHKGMVAALPVAIALVVVTMLTQMRNPYWLLILIHLLGFFVVAMVMHGELARDRPPARYLTEFYLWVAVGGMLGGVFNALIAPVVFNSVVEYPLTIILAGLLMPGAILSALFRPQQQRSSQPPQEAEREEEQRPTTIDSSNRHRLLDARILDIALPVALGIAVAALSWGVDVLLDPQWTSVGFGLLVGIGVGLCLWFAYSSSRPIRFGLGIAALIIAGTLTAGTSTIWQDRSFFGVYSVMGDEGTEITEHTLTNGDTNHGAQIFDGSNPPTPTTYYHRTGPIGQLFAAVPTETARAPFATIGLGTGTMACYAQPGQQMTFYEIDPLIEQMARNPNLFTYLRDCPGDINVVLGDARLSLEHAADRQYGVIVADAFSSDAVPVHLLTREALDIYLSKLRSDGVMAY